jgi:hypothetical protein
MEGGCVAQNLESGTTKDHFSSHYGAEDFNVIVFLIIRIICIQLVERKSPENVLRNLVVKLKIR